MIAKWKKSPWRTTEARVQVRVPHDPLVDEREAADLKQMLAAQSLRYAAFVEGLKAAEEILAAADERDALADARDVAADKREHDLDLAALLAASGDYGGDWPARRAASLDREHAKQDRIAARLDLRAMADQFASGNVCPSPRETPDSGLHDGGRPLPGPAPFDGLAPVGLDQQSEQ